MDVVPEPGLCLDVLLPSEVVSQSVSQLLGHTTKGCKDSSSYISEPSTVPGKRIDDAHVSLVLWVDTDFTELALG